MIDAVHGGPASRARPDDVADRAAQGPLAGAFGAAADEAAGALRHADPVRAVHDLRKSFKRLRALLRLVRGRGHASEARALRAALGETARRLAGARDAAARRDALDDLASKGYLSTSVRHEAGRALAGAATPADDEGAGLDPHREELVLLVESSRLTGSRFAEAMPPDELVKALVTEYARARRFGERVDPADPESLHELRKAVVAQRYQMELMIDAWPVLGKAWVDELQRLRDKLGKHHDLAVLEATVASLASGSHEPLKWRVPLGDAIAARQLRLVTSALRLHARLFAETPRAFRRRLKAYLKAVSERE